MGEVILGMPGPWADDNYEVADHSTTKVGGLPDWPTPNISISPDLLVCGRCRSNLCLLTQVYAPISSKSLTIEERVLYVFGCITPQCGSNISSWRVLRVQKTDSSEEPIQPCNDVASVPSSSLPAPKSGWQENLWTFDLGEDADGGNTGNVDIEELSRALTEATSLTSSSKKQNCDPGASGALTEATSLTSSSKKQNCDPGASVKPSTTDQKYKSHDKRFPVLPCFYIYAQEEKFSKESTSVQSKYHSISSYPSEFDLDDPTHEEAWEGENYEYDIALNADRTYLKFKKRIDANPEQCLRYSYRGRPLMASLKMGDPGACSLCGGPRLYEMQLMPPLLYFLQKATSGKQKSSLESWDWLTLIIYTCSKSCAESVNEDKSGNRGWVVAEEAVVVQFE